MENPELFLIFFAVAFLYSSIGFGGGSSYIAILAMYGIDFEALRLMALLCNITVVSFSVSYYTGRKMIDMSDTWPLIMLSIPFAFIGGRIELSKTVFLITLGMVLVFASIVIFFKRKSSAETSAISDKTHIKTKVGVGAGVGFLSGLVGIGGGVFLSPILHLIRWNSAKRIAAASSFFIMVNSMAGLLGRFSRGAIIPDWSFAILLMSAVFLGGQVGMRLGTQILSELIVRRLTSVLIFYVGVKLIFSNF